MSTGRFLPVGNPLVPYGTPTHVTEVVMLLLKLYFEKLPDGHPHKFTSDYATTGILFDTTYNKEAGVRGKKPIVIISRGNQSVGVMAVGDMVTKAIPVMLRESSNLAEATLDIKVVSKSKAECEILSQTVFGACMMLRTILPDFAGIHMVSSINMSPVQKFELDDEMFFTQIVLSYNIQYMWKTDIASEVLRSVRLQINNSNI